MKVKRRAVKESRKKQSDMRHGEVSSRYAPCVVVTSCHRSARASFDGPQSGMLGYMRAKVEGQSIRYSPVP
jgi:hypothetical protein